MKICKSHLTRNKFNLYKRRFFFGLVYYITLSGGTINIMTTTITTVQIPIEINKHYSVDFIFMSFGIMGFIVDFETI